MFKKLLAFLLSLQMGALHYAIPLVALSFSQQALGGEAKDADVEIVPRGNDKKQNEPRRIDMDGHGSQETIQQEAPAKAGFCKDPNGKMKTGCIIGLILIVGALAAILIANSNNGSSKKSTYGGSGYNGYGGGGGRPGTRPPGGGRPPRVPCCGRPAPAPAPTGGGTTVTSTVTTGNTLPTGVTPIVVTPENAQPAPTPSDSEGDL